MNPFSTPGCYTPGGAAALGGSVRGCAWVTRSPSLSWWLRATRVTS